MSSKYILLSFYVLFIFVLFSNTLYSKSVDKILCNPNTDPNCINIEEETTWNNENKNDINLTVKSNFTINNSYISIGENKSFDIYGSTDVNGINIIFNNTQFFNNSSNWNLSQVQGNVNLKIYGGSTVSFNIISDYWQYGCKQYRNGVCISNPHPEENSGFFNSPTAKTTADLNIDINSSNVSIDQILLSQGLATMNVDGSGNIEYDSLSFIKGITFFTKGKNTLYIKALDADFYLGNSAIDDEGTLIDKISITAAGIKNGFDFTGGKVIIEGGIYASKCGIGGKSYDGSCNNEGGQINSTFAMKLLNNEFYVYGSYFGTLTGDLDFTNSTFVYDTANDGINNSETSYNAKMIWGGNQTGIYYNVPTEGILVNDSHNKNKYNNSTIDTLLILNMNNSNAQIENLELGSNKYEFNIFNNSFLNINSIKFDKYATREANTSMTAQDILKSLLFGDRFFSVDFNVDASSKVSIAKLEFLGQWNSGDVEPGQPERTGGYWTSGWHQDSQPNADDTGDISGLGHTTTFFNHISFKGIGSGIANININEMFIGGKRSMYSVQDQETDHGKMVMDFNNINVSINTLNYWDTYYLYLHNWNADRSGVFKVANLNFEPYKNLPTNQEPNVEAISEFYMENMSLFISNSFTVKGAPNINWTVNNSDLKIKSFQCSNNSNAVGCAQVNLFADGTNDSGEWNSNFLFDKMEMKPTTPTDYTERNHFNVNDANIIVKDTFSYNGMLQLYDSELHTNKISGFYNLINLINSSIFIEGEGAGGSMNFRWMQDEISYERDGSICDQFIYQEGGIDIATGEPTGEWVYNPYYQGDQAYNAAGDSLSFQCHYGMFVGAGSTFSIAEDAGSVFADPSKVRLRNGSRGLMEIRGSQGKEDKGIKEIFNEGSYVNHTDFVCEADPSDPDKCKDGSNWHERDDPLGVNGYMPKDVFYGDNGRLVLEGTIYIDNLINLGVTTMKTDVNVRYFNNYGLTIIYSPSEFERYDPTLPTDPLTYCVPYTDQPIYDDDPNDGVAPLPNPDNVQNPTPCIIVSLQNNSDSRGKIIFHIDKLGVKNEDGTWTKDYGSMIVDQYGVYRCDIKDPDCDRTQGYYSDPNTGSGTFDPDPEAEFDYCAPGETGDHCLNTEVPIIDPNNVKVVFDKTSIFKVGERNQFDIIQVKDGKTNLVDTKGILTTVFSNNAMCQTTTKGEPATTENFRYWSDECKQIANDALSNAAEEALFGMHFAPPWLNTDIGLNIVDGEILVDNPETCDADGKPLEEDGECTQIPIDIEGETVSFYVNRLINYTDILKGIGWGDDLGIDIANSLDMAVENEDVTDAMQDIYNSLDYNSLCPAPSGPSEGEWINGAHTGGEEFNDWDNPCLNTLANHISELKPFSMEAMVLFNHNAINNVFKIMSKQTSKYYGIHQYEVWFENINSFNFLNTKDYSVGYSGFNSGFQIGLTGNIAKNLNGSISTGLQLGAIDGKSNYDASIAGSNISASLSYIMNYGYINLSGLYSLNNFNTSRELLWMVNDFTANKEFAAKGDMLINEFASRIEMGVALETFLDVQITPKIFGGYSHVYIPSWNEGHASFAYTFDKLNVNLYDVGGGFDFAKETLVQEFLGVERAMWKTQLFVGVVKYFYNDIDTVFKWKGIDDKYYIEMPGSGYHEPRLQSKISIGYEKNGFGLTVGYGMEVTVPNSYINHDISLNLRFIF